MELSEMQQTQISSDPNPQNPYQNQPYYYPNPNLPIHHPPLTNPYYNYQQPSDGSFVPPYSYYQDPNAPFSNPIEAATNLGVNQFTPGVALGAYPINPPQTGSKWKKACTKPKVVQSVWCEICNIECNTRDVLEVHKTGKKHIKNLSKLKESASNVPGSAPTPVSVPLESKKPKVLQSIWCQICNIECNTKAVLEVHNMGKKHIKNISKLKELASNVPASAPTPVSAPFEIPGPSTAFASTSVSAPIEVPGPSASAPTTVSTSFEIPGPSTAFAPTPVSAPFEVPGPSLASAPTHVSAPNEIAGPSLSSAPSAAASTSQCPMIGPQENPNTSSAANAKKKRKKRGEPREDLATKTRKELEGGANAAAVLTCPVCNVVCNSDTVYKFHLAGQKHAAMMKKNVVLTGGAVVN